MGEQENSKSHISPLASMFGLPRAGPAHSLGPGDSQEQSWGGAVPPVQHLGLEEQVSKGRGGLSGVAERTPVSLWELGLDPT